MSGVNVCIAKKIEYNKIFTLLTFKTYCFKIYTRCLYPGIWRALPHIQFLRSIDAGFELENYGSECVMGQRCPICGNELENNSNFCIKCGSNLSTADVSATESVGRPLLQGFSVKIGIFSAIIAALGFLFKKVDPTIGATVFALSAPMFLMSIVVTVYNFIFGKAGLLIKLACCSLYGAMVGQLLGIKSAVTAGIGICFVIVAVEAFKRIFLHK